jgi:hypothetical protein
MIRHALYGTPNGLLALAEQTMLLEGDQMVNDIHSCDASGIGTRTYRDAPSLST